VFRGLDASGNTGLWVTDGTAAGTHELTVDGQFSSAAKNIVSGKFTIDFGQLLPLGDSTALTAAFTNVLRGAPNSAFATSPTILLADGSSVPNPMYQDAQTLPTLASEAQSGQITLAQALNTIEHYGDATTAVAGIAYQFFTGATPTSGGYDYLINSAANPNNLNTAYYAKFNEENRYINFAVNLGKVGAGAASFEAAYGSLSLTDAMTQAYTDLFGFAPAAGKITALLDASVGPNETRADYFAFYGRDGLDGIGTKAAAVGWLMVEAAKADLGVYVAADDAFLAALANGQGQYNINLLTTYPAMTAGQAAAIEAQVTAGASLTHSLQVADSAANVALNLDALQALAAGHELTSVTLTDALVPVLSITASQLTSDAQALADISSPFATSASGTSAQFNGATVPNFSTHGSAIDITDLNSSALTATFVENGAGTSGQLSLSDGVHSLTVNLVGQLAAAGFSGSAASAGFALISDGHSGTDITWS
jgi:hypothetical protein